MKKHAESLVPAIILLVLAMLSSIDMPGDNKNVIIGLSLITMILARIALRWSEMKSADFSISYIGNMPVIHPLNSKADRWLNTRLPKSDTWNGGVIVHEQNLDMIITEITNQNMVVLD